MCKPCRKRLTIISHITIRFMTTIRRYRCRLAGVVTGAAAGAPAGAAVAALSAVDMVPAVLPVVDTAVGGLSVADTVADTIKIFVQKQERSLLDFERQIPFPVSAHEMPSEKEPGH